MPREFTYIAVEGPHDIEFVARLLKPNGFARVRKLSDLDPYWVNLVPKDFPPDDDLLKRVPVPLFFQTATRSVAIQSATGVSRLVSLVQGTLDIKQQELPNAVGIILDADSAQSPQQRFTAILSELSDKGVLLAAKAPAAMGDVTANSPRWGIYVLPDNKTAGTLEDVLLECADLVYPNLKAGAEAFVTGINRGLLMENELDETKNTAGLNKARVNCISSVLKPGKAIQVSIQENRWLDGKALNLPRVVAASNFLVRLIA